jgi:hypothetical protein
MTIKMRRSIPSSNPPIVMVSSDPPRLCGIGTFIEEAREFIQRANPKPEAIVVSHTDGQGEGVLPLIDMSRQNWWKPVADAIEQLDLYVVHSEGGWLFTIKRMLKDKVIQLACDESLRLSLGATRKRYWEQVVSWEVVAQQYHHA